MMDYNIGDHNPLSKALLGWTDNYVISSGSHTITLNPFTTDNRTYFIRKPTTNNIYDINGDYYSISLFSKTGVNAANHPSLTGGRIYFFTDFGIAIYKIKTGALTNPLTTGSFFANDNSWSTNKLIKYVEADNGTYVATNSFVRNSMLFKTGSKRLSTSLTNYYEKNGLDFTINVSEISNAQATFTITIH